MEADAICEHCPGSHEGARSCAASATTGAGAWLLLEHPGPWDRDVAGMPAVAGLAAGAAGHGVRVQLIRRPGRRRPVPPAMVYLAWSGGLANRPWAEAREVADLGELERLDLAALAVGRPPGFGAPLAEALFLVCTHGRRNVCCARLGGPIARELATRYSDHVWETTHVGGDRFAGNLVCLPHGLYYGDLTAADAVRAADSYRHGRIALDRYRGRGGLPSVAQAAEHAVRERLGADGAGDVSVESVAATEVVVACLGRRFRVRVRETEGDPCVPGCGEDHRNHLVTGMALLNETSLV
jgi:hypothetical protein